ncbi:AzlC family ABC transporter permease [Chitinimonas koreensis]|uniref:AzlC family ABC transporter permease n=1 Tax=Chitinimonas koreensis TaxID=356302 RepID=UPI0003FDAA38|nr:AzlC family ABC transporter permease [Chitinimonas koreensis]QNM95649.1 AzlC family ABC transporter permease [Chitinimonas koreensis]
MSPSAPPDRRSELWHGARDSLPMLVGAAPFGLIFGTLAAPSGLSPLGALAMSLFVFAGSSQFIALTLLASGTGLAVIVLTTFVVNLRHALYSATLLPHVAHLGQRWRLPLAFWLTDETFAVVQHRYGEPDASPLKHWYYLGSCLAMYLNWFAWTLGGVLLGRSVEGLDQLGLEFAMAATFTGIVVPMLKQRPMVAAALAAAAVALAARGLPYKLGLMLAALAGVVVGVWLEGRQAAPADRDAQGEAAA